MATRRQQLDPEIPNPAPLAEALGVEFVPALLELALTHSSWAYEHGQVADNERLEFLGDSVLGLAAAQLLYREHPDLSEGELSPRKHALVSTVTLAEIGRTIRVGEYLRLGRSEQITGGNNKDSILADSVEALIGAAYLSTDYVTAEQMVLRLLAPYVDQVDRLGAAMDPKTALQEIASARGAQAPEYTVSGDGPAHAQVFTATVTLVKDGVRVYRRHAEGTSKKAAENAAALAAWHELTGTALPESAN